MPEGICMKCGVTFAFDPLRPHVCGETQRAASLWQVEYELRRRLNELERRLEAIAAGQGGNRGKGGNPQLAQGATIEPKIFAELGVGKTQASALVASKPKPRFDRKSYHRRYMRQWRARQSALRKAVDPA
jgi:hypothetical protein